MTKRKFLIIEVTILLIFFLTPVFSELYEKITGAGGGFGSFIFGSGNYLDGFAISYSFFVTLALTIFGGKRKYANLAVFLLIIFFIQLGSLESLIISIGAAIAAWLIAQAILFIKRKFNKK
jgi:uncharacterized membrane protein